ncbi:MAG: putative toxin-antitoxin system toxin component, PIN family [Bacteroidaceae bacterium]|nr:putative toxin-antitoxin system toxin component, PIN family [Bacteroidaceae bacterium]
MKQFYAVFDTNVLVSALMSARLESPTVQLLDLVIDQRIVLLYDDTILAEYDEVLHREKFHFAEERIQAVLDLVKTGLQLTPTESSESFPDSDDRVFYEVALSKDGSYVVTGNLRHFPRKPIVVSPADMIKIVDNKTE